MLNPLAWRLLPCPVVPCLPRQHFVIAAAVRSMMARAKEASLSCWALRLSWSPFHLISGKHLLSRRRYNAYRPRVWDKASFTLARAGDHLLGLSSWDQPRLERSALTSSSL